MKRIPRNIAGESQPVGALASPPAWNLMVGITTVIVISAKAVVEVALGPNRRTLLIDAKHVPFYTNQK
jgi:hypothetical protein